MEDDGTAFTSEGDDDETNSEEEERNGSEKELVQVSKGPTTASEGTKHTENLSSTLRKTRDEDRKKGQAVSKQIVRLYYTFYINSTNFNRRRFGIRYLTHASACRRPFLQEIDSHP